MIKILSVIGTRPEAVKMAPLIKHLSSVPGIKSLVCLTAQHRQMLDQVLDLFGIKPDYDLNLMTSNQTLTKLTTNILRDFEPILIKVKPDWLLVQGDTTTVMTASLLAYYHHIKVGHVEAGLRTGDKYQPFPEEINRRIAGVIADLHFAPTEWSRKNLLKENIPDSRIIVTGNPVIDALKWVVDQPFDDSRLQLPNIPESRKIVLVTAHRRENFGYPLTQICQAIKSLAENFKGSVHFIYPVHLNPNVQKVVMKILLDVPFVTLLPPLDYLQLINLMKRVYLVLTDSGGIQEEATGMGIPTLVLRRMTERPEGIEAGILKLVGTEKEVIISETQKLINDLSYYQSMAKADNPFGDGFASKRIVDAILANEKKS